MAQLTPQDFEALWQKAWNGAANRAPAPTPKVRGDTSLTASLDRYGTLADTFLARQKISKIRRDALLAAIAALKTALAAIKKKILWRSTSRRPLRSGGSSFRTVSPVWRRRGSPSRQVPRRVGVVGRVG
jgi:hypothetical protein